MQFAFGDTREAYAPATHAQRARGVCLLGSSPERFSLRTSSSTDGQEAAKSGTGTADRLWPPASRGSDVLGAGWEAPPAPLKGGCATHTCNYYPIHGIESLASPSQQQKQAALLCHALQANLCAI